MSKDRTGKQPPTTSMSKDRTGKQPPTTSRPMIDLDAEDTSGFGKDETGAATGTEVEGRGLKVQGHQDDRRLGQGHHQDHHGQPDDQGQGEAEEQGHGQSVRQGQGQIRQDGQAEGCPCEDALAEIKGLLISLTIMLVILILVLSALILLVKGKQKTEGGDDEKSDVEKGRRKRYCVVGKGLDKCGLMGSSACVNCEPVLVEARKRCLKVEQGARECKDRVEKKFNELKDEADAKKKILVKNMLRDAVFELIEDFESSSDNE